MTRAFVAIACLLAGNAWGASPTPLADEMRSAGFSDAQIAKVAAGGLATHILPSPEDNAAFVAAGTRIAAPAGSFLERLRRLGAPGSAHDNRVLETGRFATPASLADLDGLHIETQDARDLGRCRVGDCDLQLGRRTMERARRVDWTAPDAEERAARLLKDVLMTRVETYRRYGAHAVPPYDDGDLPVGTAEGLDHILDVSPELVREDPQFYRYVLQYPQGTRPDDLEEFLYWSKDRLLKPVVSVVHAFIRATPDASASPAHVVLKHVYDSHYFLAYADFLTVLPAATGRSDFYLIRSVRALINPPRGWLRGLLLGRIKRAMRSELADDLAHTKQRLEDKEDGIRR